MSTAIISGITGQDGAWLAAFLSKKGYRIVGLLPTYRPSNLSRLEYLGIKDVVQFRSINLLNLSEIRELFLEISPDEFYNLAAVSSVGLSFRQPHQTFEYNTLSVINILEAIREVSSNTRFYQASSSEMFGNIGQAALPLKESFLFHPASPYGISKASAHWLTVNYREAYGLKTCCGILFNHESALRGDNFVIKKIVRTAIRISRGEHLNLPLGNVEVIRDWGYAPLYVEAMWRMLQQDFMADYLICSGTPVSLREFANRVFGALNLDLKKHLSLDAGLLRSLDLEIIYGDNSKAKRELGWDYNLGVDELIALLIKDEIDFMNWEKAKEREA